MLKRMTASQKRGALLLIAVLIAIGGWRWRLVQLEKEKSLPEVIGTEVREPSMDLGVGKATSSGRLDRSDKKSWNNGSWGKGSWDNSSPASEVRIELNAADTADLERVRGIGPVFARRIVKFRALIGGFSRKDQLLEVYGIDGDNFPRIAEQVYIEPNSSAFQALAEAKQVHETKRFTGREAKQISQESDRKNPEYLPTSDSKSTFSKENSSSTFPPAKIDLNTADSALLVSVPGIGAKTARTIVRFRSKLLFFHSLNQLDEVWGIRPENLERIKSRLTINQNFQQLPHLTINSATKWELSSHPYLDKKTAGLIISYREQHGPYHSLNDLGTEWDRFTWGLRVVTGKFLGA